MDFNKAFVSRKLTSIKRTSNRDRANGHAVEILNHFREHGFDIKIENNGTMVWRVHIGGVVGEGNNLWCAVENAAFYRLK